MYTELDDSILKGLMEERQLSVSSVKMRDEYDPLGRVSWRLTMKFREEETSDEAIHKLIFTT